MSYVYRHAALVRVVDGDTAEIIIDMGNRIRWTQVFRLYGIDTPERRQPGHGEATDRLTELLKRGLSRVETHKPDKYGRWLAVLWVAVDGGELNVNETLVAEGLAREYFGGSKG